MILVFTVLTAAREAFRRDVEIFGEELKLTANAIDRRITQVYKMTLAELELALLKDQGVLVNGLRKVRGLPELAPPASAEAPQPVPVENPGAAASGRLADV